jgi:hypothetical protein
LKTYYKNDLKSAYLILEGKEGEVEDYQVAMLRENEIPGILKTQVRHFDNCLHYYYDISGKTSFGMAHERKQLSFEDMKNLVNQLLMAMQNLKSYMLDGSCILLEPEWIYCNRGQYYFCYYPSCEQDIRKAFHQLTEFFVREVNYQDEEGVRLAYTLHKTTMEDNYNIEEIMEEFTRKEEPVEELALPEEIVGEEVEEEQEEHWWDTIVRLFKRIRARATEDL